jgi:lipopolysaccharide export LptBFGC system permease protein LptF
VTIPFAFAAGIACGWGAATTAASMFRRACILGIAGSIAALATMQWLMPVAYEMFRSATVRRAGAANVHISRGFNDRSLTDVAAVIDWIASARWPQDVETVSATIRELAPFSHDFNTLLFYFHQRVALCFAGAAVGVLALAVVSVVRQRTRARLAFGAAFVLYIASWYAAQAYAPLVPSPAAAAWLPNAAAATACLLTVALRVNAASNAASR